MLADVHPAMLNRTFTEVLESRQLFNADIPLLPADLRADTNRDGAITVADDTSESTWSSGRGAIILPNLDRDNLSTGAPDNWTGGAWNGRPAAPNHVIDNAADLADVGRLRLRQLNTDAAYNYRVTLKVLRPVSDPAWFASASAASRVRLFFPTRQLTNGDMTPTAGDVAVIGPGIGDTVRFVSNPAAINEYDIGALIGDGWFEFGVEGIKAGAGVRFQVTVEYVPLIITSEPVGGTTTEPPPSTSDTVAMRVAPFVLSDHRQRAAKVTVENMNRYGIDNAAARATLKQVFGDKLVESRSGDIWQQDGYEIGYVRAPYGAMPVVLELPRARDYFFDGQANMRSFIRGTLLASGVGVSTDLAALPNDTSSAFGGDIESIPVRGRPAGAPGHLLASGMPTAMRSFFEAQGVNPLLDLKLNDWLGVAHVDEVVHAGPNGKILVADPDVAWALALWATKLDAIVRMHPKMNSNDSLPGYTTAGVKVASVLANATFREQNLKFAQASNRLGGVRSTLKSALGLTEEVSTPVKASTNTGTASLSRGGAFAQMLGAIKRTFEVKFLDADRYQLRYRDGTIGSWSTPVEGRRSRDEVFPTAKAFLLKHYWSGTAKAGDKFTFATNPNATLVRMPVLFSTPGLFHESIPLMQSAQDTPMASSVLTPDGPGGWRLNPYSMNHINSPADGDTIITGRAYGPSVNWSGSGSKSDLFQAYATSAFKGVGYRTIVATDTRLYHDAGGNLHCGTNVIRAVPAAKWWA